MPETALPSRVLQVAAANTSAGIAGAMATVVARHGSAPATPGQKLYLAENGNAVGTVGGGAIEREVLAALRELVASADAAPSVREFRLGPELGMCCGGRVTIFLEPLAAPTAVLIVGAGHVGTALSPLLRRLGFVVHLCDARDDLGPAPADAPRTIGEYDEVGKALPVSSAVLVMTHDHVLDQDVLEWALRRGFALVGGVGSRAKALRVRERLAHKGFAETDGARVRMPMGVDVGARLPDEIAVAIAAEMVAWRRK